MYLAVSEESTLFTFPWPDKISSGHSQNHDYPKTISQYPVKDDRLLTHTFLLYTLLPEILPQATE